MATTQDGLTDEIKWNLSIVSAKLDRIRTILGAPITVHSMYRSPAYSPLVGGTSTDVHTQGKACDFHIEGMEIESVKEKLAPLLEGLDIRMEQGTPTWIHIDIEDPGPSGRYFKPFSASEVVSR
jgi:uncharacterized protein YcbK (DUF882 family)